MFAARGANVVPQKGLLSVNAWHSSHADRFQDSQKQAIGRAAGDLTTLRNALVMSQFGTDRFSEYQQKINRFSRNPDALQPDERQRVSEVADWINATRNLE